MQDLLIHDDAIFEEEAVDVRNGYFVFTLGNSSYGINVSHVREVNEYRKIFPVPQSPDYINGILNLRGDVIPVIDLGARLMGVSSEITKLTSIAVLEIEDEGEKVLMGVMIDSFDEVINLKDGSIEEVPEFGLKIRNEFASGIGKVGENFITLLNTGTLLDLDDLSDFESGRV